MQSVAGRRALDPAGLILAGAGIIAVLALLALDIANASGRPGLSINGESLWGRDFVNLWSAGRLVVTGQTAILYDTAAYQAWQAASFGPGIASHNYSYPPTSLLYAPLFGALPYGAALAVWLSVSAAAFVLAARPYLAHWRLPAAAGLLLPTSLLCLWAGHYGLVFGALWLAAWNRLDQRPVSAGILFGLLLIKPHLAVLVPVMLARRGAWRAIAAAAAAVALLVLTSWLLFGSAPWRIYFDSTAGLQLALIGQPHDLFGLMMPTLAPALLAYGVSLQAAMIAQFGVALVAAAALLWRAPADARRAGLATATATFLVLPYGFNYDLTIVGVGAVVLLAEASAERRRGDALLGGLALAIAPATMFLAAMGARVAPLVLGALLARQLARR